MTDDHSVVGRALSLLHLRIRGTSAFFPLKKKIFFLNEPNLLSFHLYDMHLAVGFVLTTYSCLDAALASRARATSFRY